MRAARLHRFGGPDVLQIDEVAWPMPKGDEVLIHVTASSINGTDLNLRRGGLGPVAAGLLPFTVGFDVAGVVTDCGPLVTAFRPGDRVMSLLGHRGGGAADYVTVRQGRVGSAPHSIDLEMAASVPLSGLTALQALRHAGRLQPGRLCRVLVYGAAGGIGAFAVQLARILGAHVTATARPSKLTFLRDLGAHAVMDSADVTWDGAHEPWDIILDTPPALSFQQVEPALSAHGVLISTRGVPGRARDAAALLNRRRPHFATVRTAERGIDLGFLTRLIDAGELHPPLDRIFALEDISRAHQYAEGDDVRGKVVVSAAR